MFTQLRGLAVGHWRQSRGLQGAPVGVLQPWVKVSAYVKTWASSAAARWDMSVGWICTTSGGARQAISLGHARQWPFALSVCLI